MIFPKIYKNPIFTTNKDMIEITELVKPGFTITEMHTTIIGFTPPPIYEPTAEDIARAEKVRKVIYEVRNKTGCGLMDCKKALLECEYDVDRAVLYLKGH